MENKNFFDNSFWTFIHTITFLYPDNPTLNEKKQHYIFFKNLPDLIPCNICKENYKKNMEKLNGNTEDELNIDLNNKLKKMENMLNNPYQIIFSKEEDTKEGQEEGEEEEEEEENNINIHDDENIINKYIDNLYYLKSKENFSRKMYLYHNKVNRKLNKKEYSYEEVKEYYENIIQNSDMLNKKKDGENDQF